MSDHMLGRLDQTRIDYDRQLQSVSLAQKRARFADGQVPFHRLTMLSAYADDCCPTGQALLMLEANRSSHNGRSSAPSPAGLLRVLQDLGIIGPDVRLVFSDTGQVEHSAIFMHVGTHAFLD